MAPKAYDPDSENEQAPPLPSAPLITLSSNLVIQPPLTSRGSGPGIVLLLQNPSCLSTSLQSRRPLDPEPVQKWAEEGFTVAGVTLTPSSVFDQASAISSVIKQGIDCLLQVKELDDRDKFAVIGNSFSSRYVLVTAPRHFFSLWQRSGSLGFIDRLGKVTNCVPDLLWSFFKDDISKAQVSDSPTRTSEDRCCGKYHFILLSWAIPALCPTADLRLRSRKCLLGTQSVSCIPTQLARGSCFWSWGHLGSTLLLRIWSSECRKDNGHDGGMLFFPRQNDYKNHNLDYSKNLMSIMFQQCVHGHAERLAPHTALDDWRNWSCSTDRVLSRSFYIQQPGWHEHSGCFKDCWTWSHHWYAFSSTTFNWLMWNVSDEFIFYATHDRTIDWLLPGVPPTGKKLSIPMIAVVNIRGDRLYNGKRWRPCCEESNSVYQSIFGGIRLQHFSKQDYYLLTSRTLHQMVPEEFCVCQWLEYKVLKCFWMRPMAKAMRWWDVIGESALTSKNLQMTQRSPYSGPNTCPLQLDDKLIIKLSQLSMYWLSYILGLTIQSTKWAQLVIILQSSFYVISDAHLLMFTSFQWLTMSFQNLLHATRGSNLCIPITW